MKGCFKGAGVSTVMKSFRHPRMANCEDPDQTAPLEAV